MQAVAEKTNAIDTAAYEGFLRVVLSTTEVGRDNALADWINTRPRPTSKEALLRHWRSKRDHHQATATRAKPGGGIPLDASDYEKGPYVQAIHALPYPYPAQLRGAFAESPELPEIAAIAMPVLGSYRKQGAMIRAASLLQWYLRRHERPKDAKGAEIPVWEICGLTKDDWNGSEQRKAYDRVKAKLRAEIRPAIQAWVRECQARGLEV